VISVAPTRGQLSIDGHTYQHGLQFGVSNAYPRQGASYAIPPGARRFSAAIGNDDTQPNPIWSSWQLSFEVFVDGRRVAIGHALGTSHDQTLDVDLSGASRLELQINGTPTFGSTLADWGDPQFQ
jgi:hypothetical protein